MGPEMYTFVLIMIICSLGIGSLAPDPISGDVLAYLWFVNIDYYC